MLRPREDEIQDRWYSGALRTGGLFPNAAFRHTISAAAQGCSRYRNRGQCEHPQMSASSTSREESPATQDQSVTVASNLLGSTLTGLGAWQPQRPNDLGGFIFGCSHLYCPQKCRRLQSRKRPILEGWPHCGALCCKF